MNPEPGPPSPHLERVLKEDALGRVELLRGGDGSAVRRVGCGSRAPLTRFVARRLLARERRALERLAGVPGVPELLDGTGWVEAPFHDASTRAPRDVLLRSWIDGVPLHATETLRRDFFDRLAELVGVVHAYGVCHNDLHKEPNILVDPDGRPALVDFQLASVHPRCGRRFAHRSRQDCHYVAKHRQRYESGGAVPRSARSGDRPFVAELWMRLGKPVYNVLTRRLMHWRDDEPRRPRGGPWPQWIPPDARRDR